MGPAYAVCLLVARLTAAEEPATPPPVSPAVVEPTEARAPEATPAPPPPPTRLALRDPFEHVSGSAAYRMPVSPDLLDPFTRPPRAVPQVHSRDLRDPFVDGAVRRCIPQLHGVPLQRPRVLDQSAAPCAVIDKPLRNPFVAPTPRG